MSSANWLAQILPVQKTSKKIVWKWRYSIDVWIGSSWVVDLAGCMCFSGKEHCTPCNCFSDQSIWFVTYLLFWKWASMFQCHIRVWFIHYTKRIQSLTDCTLSWLKFCTVSALGSIVFSEKGNKHQCYVRVHLQTQSEQIFPQVWRVCKVLRCTSCSTGETN